MSLGELIVYWADGEVQTYELEKTTTTIGRSTGNDIVLPTSSASRYHAHVVVDEGRATFVDLGSVNGSFIDDQLLEPNASVELTGNEEIRIGDVRLVYRPSGGATVFPAVISMDETQPVSPASPTLLMALEEPQQTVAPGARLQLALAIENLTDGVRTLDVDLSGVDAEWIKASRHEVHLDKRETTEVLIQLRPPRGPEMKPGRYTLLVTVTPHDAPEQSIQQTRHVDIASYHGLTVAVRPASQADTFNVIVENQGNVAANVQLGGWHLKRALKFDFAKTRLSLAPGKTRQVSLRVRPRQGRRLPEPTTFAVVARSLDVSGYQAAVPAHYAGSGEKAGQSVLLGAIVPASLVVLLGVVALLIVVAAVGYFFFRDQLLGALEPLLPAAVPTATLPLPTETATPTASATPEPTLFPAPALTEASFVPPEVVRYQDVPVLLRYSIEAGADTNPEEVALELFDETTHVSLVDFTVVEFNGTVDLPALLGPRWLSFVYDNDTPPNYSLRASARDSQQASFSVTSFLIRELDCRVPADLEARTGPGEEYPVDDSSLTDDERYWPTAQHDVEGVTWYRVQPDPDGKQRWLRADVLACTTEGNDWRPPPGFRFIEASDVPPPPTS